MITEQELEVIRNTMGAMIDMGENGPFDPAQRDIIGAVHNMLCYILEDGSEHANTFQRNWKNLLKWCDESGVRFIPVHNPNGQPQ